MGSYVRPRPPSHKPVDGSLVTPSPPLNVRLSPLPPPLLPKPCRDSSHPPTPQTLTTVPSHQPSYPLPFSPPIHFPFTHHITPSLHNQCPSLSPLPSYTLAIPLSPIKSPCSAPRPFFLTHALKKSNYIKCYIRTKIKVQ